MRSAAQPTPSYRPTSIGALPGEVPASLSACHALLLDLPATHLAPLIGIVRQCEADSAVRLFSLEVLCAGLDLDRTVRLCAALPPTVTNAAGVPCVCLARAAGVAPAITYVCAFAHSAHIRLLHVCGARFSPLLVS